MISMMLNHSNGSEGSPNARGRGRGGRGRGRGRGPPGLFQLHSYIFYFKLSLMRAYELLLWNML